MWVHLGTLLNYTICSCDRTRGSPMCLHFHLNRLNIVHCCCWWIVRYLMTDYIASDVWMIYEWWLIEKDLERSGRNLLKAPGTCLEGLSKAMKILSQDSRCPGRDSNRIPHPLPNTNLERYLQTNLFGVLLLSFHCLPAFIFFLGLSGLWTTYPQLIIIIITTITIVSLQVGTQFDSFGKYTTAHSIPWGVFQCELNVNSSEDVLLNIAL
jgi:hypothetical protein